MPPILAFKWRKDGADLTDYGRIAGTTNSCLRISEVQTNDVGDYSVRVQAENGTVASSPAALWLGPLTQFISKTMLTNGIFQVDFVGEPGRLYNIEAAPDPSFQGATCITNFFCGEGLIRVIDWQAGQFTNRFYRAVSSY